MKSKYAFIAKYTDGAIVYSHKNMVLLKYKTTPKVFKSGYEVDFGYWSKDIPGHEFVGLFSQEAEFYLYRATFYKEDNRLVESLKILTKAEALETYQKIDHWDYLLCAKDAVEVYQFPIDKITV